MSLIDTFSEEALTDFFKHNLQLDTNQNFKYSVKSFSRNENIFSLKVASENEDFHKELIMVKMLDGEAYKKKENEYINILKNVSTVRDDNKDVYLAFAKEGVLYPFRNNLENLRQILKDLAEFQARDLANRAGETIKTSECIVENVADAVISLDFFKDLDKGNLSDTISTLQKSIDALFKNDLLVKSVGNISANNVFITTSEKCVFLDLGYELFRSPVYDALFYIFALTDERFRQHHLKTLLKLYHQTFTKFIEKINQNVAFNFNLNVFENHVNIFLPIVKFKTAQYLIQKDSTVQKEKYLDELLNNIWYSLKYPQISYEDCLEAISTKLGSTEFELVDYSFIPLDEKNGHLGEYFSLKSTVKYSGETEELSMFTKSLKTGNELVNAVVHSGASKKEQFFFRTLIPLLKQYGLGSLVDFAPNYYFDRLNDLIILEDLAELGYKPFKANTILGYDVLRLAFLKAAKMHACTFLLEDRMSKSEGRTVRLGDVYGEFMEDWLFQDRQDLPKAPINATYSKPGLDQLIDSFTDVPKVISKEEFQKRVDSIYESFSDSLASPPKQFKHVICHGDLYASNLLVKYKENNVPTNCCIIDYQNMRYAPLTGDLLTLVYCNTNKEVRDKYLDILLEEYYQELKEILSGFGIDITTLYTFKEHIESARDIKPVIIIAAICYAQVTALSPEKKEEMFFCKDNFKYYIVENRKEFIRDMLGCSEDYTNFLKGLIEDLYDVCINL